MKRITLNGAWQFKALEESKWQKGIVPGSLYADLMENGLLDDPYYRDNEDKTRDLCEKDYEYRRVFQVDESFLKADKILLKADGLDTLCEIYINSQLIAKTDNMHIRYEFDIKEQLSLGENDIHFLFR